ncbi:hypothetical protein L0Y46_00850 [bacterium]|nr:hypothetical protein [bacterium]
MQIIIAVFLLTATSFPRKKKSKSTEFRLARDKDQVEEIVSNISDAERKSQEFFLPSANRIEFPVIPPSVNLPASTASNFGLIIFTVKRLKSSAVEIAPVGLAPI